LPGPSYATVLRVARDARAQSPRPRPYLEEIVGKLPTVRFPNLHRADGRSTLLDHEADVEPERSSER
jgi:hypothetical protein